MQLIGLIGKLYIGLIALIIVMTTITVSENTRVTLVRMKDENLTSIEKVILNLVSDGKSPTQSTDVDYSQCPNCEEHKANGAQQSIAKDMLQEACDEQYAEIKNLKKQQEDAQQNGGGDGNCEKLKEQLEAQEDTITGKTTLIEGMEKTISDLTKENDRLKDKNHKEIAHRDNKESQVHMTGGQ